MAFTIEDGTGLEDSNSYATVEEFENYHDERGNDYSTIDIDVIEQLLIKATDYIERKWGPAFLGYPEFDDQALSFPRLGIYDKRGNEVTGVPTKLKQATAEYALKASVSPLFLEPTPNEYGLTVSRYKVIVGPLEEDTSYQSSTSTTTKAMPNADYLLTDLILPWGRTIRA
mgnify:CR=1 FL=1